MGPQGDSFGSVYDLPKSDRMTRTYDHHHVGHQRGVRLVGQGEGQVLHVLITHARAEVIYVHVDRSVTEANDDHGTRHDERQGDETSPE